MKQRSDLDNNILNSLGEAVVTGELPDIITVTARGTPRSRGIDVYSEDEVVVPPEGIGPLLYGRSLTPIKSGLESLKEMFLGGLRNISGLPASKASTRFKISDTAKEIISNSRDLDEATFMFFPYLRELAPGATYQDARSYLNSIMNSEMKTLDPKPQYRSPNDLRGVFQDTERQEQDAILRELEELQSKGELGDTPAYYNFEAANRDRLALESSLTDDKSPEQISNILRQIRDIDTRTRLARSGELFAE